MKLYFYDLKSFLDINNVFRRKSNRYFQISFKHIK